MGWEKNPHLPIIALYVNDGVVEIWENKKAIKWFWDNLLSANQDENFIKNLFNEYKNDLSELKELHAKKFISSSTDVQKYIDLIYRAAFKMTIFFYTGMDERSPVVAKNISIQAREEGDFFADNDLFARRNIAKLGNISEELAGVVFPEELNAIPSGDILQKRLEAFILIDGKELLMGDLKECSEKYPDYYFIQSREENLSGEIAGQVAYKGSMQGVVCIVKKQSDISKIKKRDILVSPMTTPDFLPAMKLAGAFVTDEGGITCHAAIVAREMKKPCIIGTKIATQVLKDGDLVEVDAERGIVKILRKAGADNEDRHIRDEKDQAKSRTKQRSGSGAN